MLRNNRKTVRKNDLLVFGILMGMLACCPNASALDVFSPAADLKVAAGDDFATQVLGDPWDFDRIEDTFTPNARDLVNQDVTDGIFTFETVDETGSGSTKAQFWLIHPGLKNAQRLVNETRNAATGLSVFSREKFPIDPSRYRYLSLRVRYTSATEQALQSNVSLVVYYFQDQTSIGDAKYGGTNSVKIPPNEWVTISIDLAENIDPQWVDSWPLMPSVEGLRIDPATAAGIKAEFDWIRLTAEPGPEHELNVSWVDNGSEAYNVSAFALDWDDSQSLVLAEAVSANTATVALHQLPPGQYRIAVTGNNDSGVSVGTIQVNDVPLVEITAPNIKGDQSLAYGRTEATDSWESIEAVDVEEALGFDSFSYDNPSGTFYGRPTDSSPRVLMNTPVPIDTALYRMLCFESEILGPRNIGKGSVTKVLWGNKRADLTTPSPVIAHEGLNEYCVGDMAELLIDPFTPPNAENAWIGPIENIRYDPHEFPRDPECNSNPSPELCRDVRFASFILAPFHSANPDFTFHWRDSDADDDARISIYLDEDRMPGNDSLEYLVGVVQEDEIIDSLNWTPNGVPNGLWHVYAFADDGWNTHYRYAGGPLLIGPPQSARVIVTAPGPQGQEIKAGGEYGLKVRRDQWDMDGDDLNLTRIKNIDDAQLKDGKFSGTTTNNQSQFILMSAEDGDPFIDAARYRYLTLKVRIEGGDRTNFLQVFYSDNPEFDPARSFGFTSGKPLVDDSWRLMTFDLATDVNASSKYTWNEFGTVGSIRIDPTNAEGAYFEIDWITLSANPSSGTEYTIKWAAENTGTSGFDVFLLDQMGHRFEIISGLPLNSRSHPFQLSQLPLGDYSIEVVAVPGPADISAGSLRLVETLTIEGLLFRDGFEQ